MSATQERLRVLHVVTSYPPEFSGHGRQVRSLVPYLARLGVDSAVLTSRAAAGGLEERVEGTPVTRLPRTPGRRGHLSFAARACLFAARRRRDFDVVHYQGADWPAVAGVPVLGSLGTPTVVSLTLLGVDDPLSLRHSRLGWLGTAALRRADRVFAISSALAESARRAGWRGAAIREIPVGVDVARFRPPDEAERAEARRALGTRFGFDPRGPIVSFVGAVVRRKGIDLLLSAWPGVAAAAPGATLVVAGPTDDPGGSREFSPGYAEGVFGDARRPGVVRTGPLDDAAAVYRASDVFVLPSRGEGLPNVVLEALASGVPTIVSRLPGVAGEVVADGETGLVVPQEDPAALSRAILALLSNPELRAGVAARARQLVLDRFAFERVAHAMAAEYAALARRRRSSHE